MLEIGVPEKQQQSIPETSLEAGFGSVETQEARKRVENIDIDIEDSDKPINPEVGVKSALGNIQAVENHITVSDAETSMLSSAQLENIIHDQQIALGQGDKGINAKQLLDNILRLSQNRKN